MSKPKIAEGKTKIFHASVVIGEMKDDMTAGNGARHEIVPGKGAWCNAINTYVFDRLNDRGIKTTFRRKLGPTTYEALASVMLPYEVAVMLEADPKSSLLKRRGDLKPGVRFESPIVQFHLKTTNCEFRGIKLPWDDPIISNRDDTGVWVNDPAKPVAESVAIFIPAEIVYGKDKKPHNFDYMGAQALRVAAVLDSAFTGRDCKLVDFKIEFDDEYRVSDVLTPDEWRAFDTEGKPLSKQPFRNGASIEEMQAIYEKMAYIGSSFWIV